jgi:hypothetical protein
MIRIKNKSGIRSLMAIAIVLAVLFVLIAPTLNLAPSALRASRAAQILFLCLVLCLSLMTDAVSVAGFQYACDFCDSDYGGHANPLQQCGLLDLNCTRLC